MAAGGGRQARWRREAGGERRGEGAGKAEVQPQGSAPLRMSREGPAGRVQGLPRLCQQQPLG